MASKRPSTDACLAATERTENEMYSMDEEEESAHDAAVDEIRRRVELHEDLVRGLEMALDSGPGREGCEEGGPVKRGCDCVECATFYDLTDLLARVKRDEEDER